MSLFRVEGSTKTVDLEEQEVQNFGMQQSSNRAEKLPEVVEHRIVAILNVLDMFYLRVEQIFPLYVRCLGFCAIQRTQVFMFHQIMLIEAG